MELLAYRPVRKKGTNLTALITAIAMSFVLENLAQAIPAIGPDPRVPYTLFSKTVTIGKVSISSATFITILVVVIVSFLAAGILAALLGLIVGIPALRLKGDYLAIITLGFGMIIVNLINNIPFCGQQGLGRGVASSSLYANGLGLSNDDKMKYMWIGVVTVIICMTIMFMFVRSKYGRIIRAIRDNEIAASASGINVSFYKVLTFAFTNGSILNSVFIVVMVVIGGMGSLTGSVVAAIGMFILNYIIKNGAWVNALPGFLKSMFTYPMLVYSIALIIVIMFRPHGIMGTKEFALCDIPK